MILSHVLQLLQELVAIAEFKPGMSLEQISAEYNKKVYNSLIDYANSDRNIVAFRNQFKRAVNDAFTLTATAGWVDGGGNGPIPQGLRDWLIERIEGELEFVNEVFVKLKLLRKTGSKAALEEFAKARAQGYTDSLVGVYAYGKALAMLDEWGTWEVGATEHCQTCIGLNGKRRKISWFLKNGYIPQESGSKTLKCKGFRCQCTVKDDEGRQILP